MIQLSGRGLVLGCGPRSGGVNYQSAYERRTSSKSVMSGRSPSSMLVREGWGTLDTLAGTCRRYSLERQIHRLRGSAGISHEVMMACPKHALEAGE